MSYEKDQFGAGPVGGEGSVSVSSMITTALAPYVTSASLVTALGTYITSNSVSIALATYITSNSVSIAIANFITSNSASIMITSRLSTYITSSSVATALAPYLTSASLVTTLGTYVTSSSLATAVGTLLSSSSFATAISTYITSNSVSIALALKQPNFSVADEGATLSTVAGTVTTINFVGSGISASLTGGLLTVTAVAGAGSGEGSVSISTMISTALGPYLTSNSASAGYARLAATNTYSQDQIITDGTNGVLLSPGQGAIELYRSDDAAYIDFKTTAAEDYDARIQAASNGLTFQTGGNGATANRLTITSSGDVNVLGPMAVSATASCAAITLAGKPVGCVLLGYQTLSNVNSWSFSGSWSDYAILQARALYRIETGTSATASAAIYTDGGTTAFLSLRTASTTQSANQIISVEYHVYGGDGRPIKLLEVNSRKQTNLQTFAVTATANTGFVNAIKYFSSATITAGMAVLYGFRKA